MFHHGIIFRDKKNGEPFTKDFIHGWDVEPAKKKGPKFDSESHPMGFIEHRYHGDIMGILIGLYIYIYILIGHDNI